MVTEVPPEQATPAAEASSDAAGKAPAVSPELAEFRVKDNQAFTIITLNIKHSQIPHIQRCETAKQAWDALHEVHQGIGANGRMVLTQRLWSLRLREGEDMASHLNEFRDLANQIANLSAGDESTQIQGVDLVSMLSLSLPDSYEPLIMALQSRSEEPTFDFMAGRRLQESTRRQAGNANGNSPSNGNGQSAFKAGSGRTRGRGGNFRGNRSSRGARFYFQGRSNFGVVDVTRFENAGANQCQAKMVTGRYHYCDKGCHWKNECWKRKANEAGGKLGQEEEGGHTALTATTVTAQRKRHELC